MRYAAYRLSKFLKSNWWGKVLGAVVVAVFVGLVPGLIALRRDFQQVEDILKANTWLAGVGYLWALIALSIRSVVSDYMKDAEKRFAGPTDEDFAKLLETVNEIVSHKANGCVELARESRNGGPAIDPNMILQRLARPRQQMFWIVHGFFTYLKSIDLLKKRDIKVVLAEMGDDGHVSKWICYFPNTKRPADEKNFRDDNCGFSKACRAKQLLIYENIKNEVFISGTKLSKKKAPRKRYLRSDNDSPVGSMLVFPIQDPISDRYQYCLSVKVDAPYLFLRQLRKPYEDLLDVFKTRLTFESSVLSLLKATEAKQEPPL